MNSVWMNFALEIGFFSLLGVLYYFYQKRKLLKYEENKCPLVMSFILQTCLAEKTDSPQPELDELIIALDDYVNNKTPHAPLSQLKTFSHSPHCPLELKEIIVEGLKELEA